MPESVWWLAVNISSAYVCIIKWRHLYLICTFWNLHSVSCCTWYSYHNTWSRSTDDRAMKSTKVQSSLQSVSCGLLAVHWSALCHKAVWPCKTYRMQHEIVYRMVTLILCSIWGVSRLCQGIVLPTIFTQILFSNKADK